MQNAGVLALIAVLASSAGSAAAAEPFPACQSQQSMQQLLDSNGALKPDDCRSLVVTPVGTGAQRLCAISFSAAGGDILQKLRDVALPDQWWVRCDSLGAIGR